MATVRPASGIGMIASNFYGMVAVPIKDQSMPKDSKSSKDAKEMKETGSGEDAAKALAEAETRLASTGRNDPCPCGSGKKYKKCHLQGDESVAIKPVAPPDAQELLMNGWRLF